MEERVFPGGDMLHMLSMASIQLALLRHADRVKIGCMTGGLHALCASNHDHVWKSASHYAMTQLMSYAKGMSMQTDVESETFDLPGYAIDDTSQYTGKEGLPYIDSATAWNEKEGRLTVFVINRNDKEEYPLMIDISGFKGYELEQHLELADCDLEFCSTYEVQAKAPIKNDEASFERGMLTTHVKPLSWNVLCFQKKC